MHAPAAKAPKAAALAPTMQVRRVRSCATVLIYVYQVYYMYCESGVLILSLLSLYCSVYQVYYM